MITPLHRPVAGRLRGAWTALITPFVDGELDLDSLRALAEHQIASGMDGLLVGGSTGEAQSLTDDEFRSIVSTVVEVAAGRVPVCAGTTTSATATTIARTRVAHEAGADLALVAPPPYMRPTQAGIVAHMEAAAAATPLPLVLYNVPARTGSDIVPETAARLSRTPGILGIKEASGDIERVAHIASQANADFVIFAGMDSHAVPIMALGGVGVMSIAGNVAPSTIAALTDAALAGDFSTARAMQIGLVELNRALFVEASPIPVKAAAGLLGFGNGEVRLPLTPATSATVEVLNRSLRTIEETIELLRVSRPEPRPTI